MQNFSQTAAPIERMSTLKNRSTESLVSSAIYLQTTSANLLVLLPTSSTTTNNIKLKPMEIILSGNCRK